MWNSTKPERLEPENEELYRLQQKASVFANSLKKMMKMENIGIVRLNETVGKIEREREWEVQTKMRENVLFCEMYWRDGVTLKIHLTPEWTDHAQS